jgi:hypothetical protein
MSRPSLKRAMSEANQLASAWNNRESLYAPPSIVEQRIAEQFDGKIRRARLRLDVPYAEKDAAKALSSRAHLVRVHAHRRPAPLVAGRRGREGIRKPLIRPPASQIEGAASIAAK